MKHFEDSYSSNSWICQLIYLIKEKPKTFYLISLCWTAVIYFYQLITLEIYCFIVWS